MEYKNIFLTGGSGKLGQAIVNSGEFRRLISPSHNVLDIRDAGAVRKFFEDNNIDAVIHCAALARMAECEKDPAKAVEVNIVGTANLVAAVVRKEKAVKRTIRFVYISTDGVYAGKRGGYSEKDAPSPYNGYGWTKLGGECAVRVLSNYCIIRASFFDPGNIPFDKAPVDAYSSRVPLEYFVKAVKVMLESDFTGVINIGEERRAEFERYKKIKPAIQPCRFEEIQNEVPFPLAQDSSLDISLWKEIKEKERL